MKAMKTSAHAALSAAAAWLWVVGFVTGPALADDILMVTNNNTTTQSLVDFLEANGHLVTRGQFGDAVPDQATLDAHDLILISRETNSGDYDDGTEPQDWNALPLPMISMAPHLMRANRWGWMDGDTLPSIADVSGFDPFANPDHPFLAGVSSPTILDPPLAITGATDPLPDSARVVATLDGGNSHGIFWFPAGTQMFADRGVAGGTRIGYLRGNEESWNNITAGGGQILLNMIDTAATIPEPSTFVLAIVGLAGLTWWRVAPQK